MLTMWRAWRGAHCRNAKYRRNSKGLRTVRLFRMVGAIPRNRPHCVTVRNAFQVAARCPDSPSSVNLVKKAVVGILNRVPVVLIVIGEALVIYLATAVAKLAFTQLDPLYSVWYRVGFMAVLLLLWCRPWSKAKRAQLFHRDARGWGLVVLLGCSLKLLALLFVISLMASFIPYVVEQITLRRTTSGAFSVMQSINPAMAVAVGLAFGEIPSVGEIIGVALVICAVIVTFSGDAAPADGQ